MKVILIRLIAYTGLFCLTQNLFSQDITGINTVAISQYIDKISEKSRKLESKVDKESEKALSRFKKQEVKLKRKLMKIDSLAIKNVFTDADQKYKELEKRINGGTSGQYIPKLDTLITSLKFLEQNPQFLQQTKEVKEKLDNVLNKVNGLKDQFRKADEIKKFLKERKQFLKDQLSNFGFAKELKKLNKGAYYYAQQINEYKEILKDSKKAEQKALELLSKTKLFKDFMRKNSKLASLFRLPGNLDDPSSQASLAGLQTRAQINQLIQNQIAAGGPGAGQTFRQNIQSAQSQLNQLKNKVIQIGGSNSDDILPEGFKPNSEKTKSFLQRLEYGINVQSQSSTNFLPITSDLGVSLGYKLNDKSVIGIGASYKMGWGRGWNHIKISNEGLGIRSFIDWRIKGSFYISGGYEKNYRSAFQNFFQLNTVSGWQQSGLLGVSKTISAKTRFFKKTKIQLLWDLLSYDQVPVTQPLVFRIGYNF